MTLEILSGQAPKVASPEPPHTRLANARRVPSNIMHELSVAHENSLGKIDIDVAERRKSGDDLRATINRTECGIDIAHQTRVWISWMSKRSCTFAALGALERLRKLASGKSRKLHLGQGLSLSLFSADMCDVCTCG